MQLADILKVVHSKYLGELLVVIAKSEVKLTASAKKAGNEAHKVNMIPSVVGISYSDLKSVQEKVANGEKVLTHELPFGEWSKEPDEKNLIINHKTNKYLRIYPKDKIFTKYYLNGKEVSLEELKESELVQPSYFNKKSNGIPECMTLNIDNIENIIA